MGAGVVFGSHEEVFLGVHLLNGSKRGFMDLFFEMIRISGPYRPHEILAPVDGFSTSLILLLASLASFLLLEKIIQRI